MPIFEYKCKICGNVEEKLVMPGDKENAGYNCPICGKGKMWKIISPGSFQISGYNYGNLYGLKKDEKSRIQN